MFAISEFKSNYGGGYNKPVSQVASQVSRSVIENQVAAVPAAAWKDSAKAFQGDVSGVQNDFPPDYLKQLKSEFPPNLLKKAYEGNNTELPPNMLKKQDVSQAQQPEFPKDVLKEYAEKFPPNYLEEFMNQRLTPPAQGFGGAVQKQAILAYSSNAQV